ncbi:MAG: hypothetical protein R3E84_21845 [Pseudomonadales bacterium]
MGGTLSQEGEGKEAEALRTFRSISALDLQLLDARVVLPAGEFPGHGFGSDLEDIDLAQHQRHIRGFISFAEAGESTRRCGIWWWVYFQAGLARTVQGVPPATGEDGYAELAPSDNSKTIEP